MTLCTWMTPADWRALEHLCTYPATFLVRPGNFGESLWGMGSVRGRVRNLLGLRRGAGNCSCPFARPAGKVLNRLKAAGYAEWVSIDNPKDWGWRATKAGRTANDERIGT